MLVTQGNARKAALIITAVPNSGKCRHTVCACVSLCVCVSRRLAGTHSHTLTHTSHEPGMTLASYIRFLASSETVVAAGPTLAPLFMARKASRLLVLNSAADETSLEKMTHLTTMVDVPMERLLAGPGPVTLESRLSDALTLLAVRALQQGARGKASAPRIPAHAPSPTTASATTASATTASATTASAATASATTASATTTSATTASATTAVQPTSADLLNTSARLAPTACLPPPGPLANARNWASEQLRMLPGGSSLYSPESWARIALSGSIASDFNARSKQRDQCFGETWPVKHRVCAGGGSVPSGLPSRLRAADRDTQIMCHTNPATESTLCDARRLVLRPARVTVARGGEPVESVHGRAEETELPVYARGAWSGSCRLCAALSPTDQSTKIANTAGPTPLRAKQTRQACHGNASIMLADMGLTSDSYASMIFESYEADESAVAACDAEYADLCACAYTSVHENLDPPAPSVRFSFE
jgi:hypothetical protein